MAKPAGYPLPWCERLDMPYFRVNMLLIFSRQGWSEWQARKSMAEIIPVIDDLLGALNATAPTTDHETAAGTALTRSHSASGDLRDD